MFTHPVFAHKAACAVNPAYVRPHSGVVAEHAGVRFLVHRLVAFAFVPNPNDYPHINHKDENKLNNSAENLKHSIVTTKDGKSLLIIDEKQLLNVLGDKFELHLYNSRLAGETYNTKLEIDRNATEDLKPSLEDEDNEKPGNKIKGNKNKLEKELEKELKLKKVSKKKLKDEDEDDDAETDDEDKDDEDDEKDDKKEKKYSILNDSNYFSNYFSDLSDFGAFNNYSLF